MKKGTKCYTDKIGELERENALLRGAASRAATPHPSSAAGLDGASRPSPTQDASTPSRRRTEEARIHIRTPSSGVSGQSLNPLDQLYGKLVPRDKCPESEASVSTFMKRRLLQQVDNMASNNAYLAPFKQDMNGGQATKSDAETRGFEMPQAPRRAMGQHGVGSRGSSRVASRATPVASPEESLP